MALRTSVMPLFPSASSEGRKSVYHECIQHSSHPSRRHREDRASRAKQIVILDRPLTQRIPGRAHSRMRRFARIQTPGKNLK